MIGIVVLVEETVFLVSFQGDPPKVVNGPVIGDEHFFDASDSRIGVLFAYGLGEPFHLCFGIDVEIELQFASHGWTVRRLTVANS